VCGFAIAKEFLIWGVQCIQLMLILGLLLQDAAHPTQQVLRWGLLVHWQLVQLLLQFKLCTTHTYLSQTFHGG